MLVCRRSAQGSGSNLMAELRVVLKMLDGELDTIKMLCTLIGRSNCAILGNRACRT